MSGSKSIPTATSSDALAGSVPGQRYVPQMAMLMGESRSPPMGPVKPTNMGGVDTCGLFNFSIPAHPEASTSASSSSSSSSATPSEHEPVAADLPRLWKLTKAYLPKTPMCIMDQIARHIEFSLARSQWNFDAYALYQATAYSVRDRLIEFWNDTQEHFTDNRLKRMYYLSIEYLMGRYLRNAISNMRLTGNFAKALDMLGAKLEDLYDEEQDAALGNGGLGRLAACFLDSLATLNYPAWGYGIRYEFGMFKQQIINGQQAEVPDYWLEKGNPWEICRSDVNYRVQFGGNVTAVMKNGTVHYKWDCGHVVIATAYDTPVPGFGTMNTLNLRLWSATPATVFDLEQFNREDQHPDYYSTLNARQKDENITKVLYPKTTPKGLELRLKQQYFFCCATLQDVIRRFKKMQLPFSELPNYVAIQLNDTHPTIAIAELMRILVDLEDLPFDEAFALCQKCFAYTNHTVMPEALETWPVPMFEYLLPRHLQIIYDINFNFINLLRSKMVDGKPMFSDQQIADMSIIQEGFPKRIRMANLAVVCSHKVNGVAAIHSEILKDQLFHNFHLLWPDKITNITNGVTPRRWLVQCNPALSTILTKELGDTKWVTDLEQLSKIREKITPQLMADFREAKLLNKQVLRRRILQISDGKIDVNVNAMFDIQVKRIHEYKRQLMNILGVVSRYLTIKKMTPEQRKNVVQKVVIFAGKAAAGYEIAKLVIKLINAVADVINADHEIGDLLKVVFIPNYSVSRAEEIIPASDLSQHISTAGTEASGTSNMKFVMNGGLLIGTLDGANIEIMEHIGAENIFIFGAKKDEIAGIRSSPAGWIDERLYDVLKAIQDGMFGSGDQYYPLIEPLWHGNDYYCVAHDFPLYLACLEEVDRVWKNQDEWTRRCIMSVAGVGYFSSDRTIHEYAQKIWGLKPSPLPRVHRQEEAK